MLSVVGRVHRCVGSVAWFPSYFYVLFHFSDDKILIKKKPKTDEKTQIVCLVVVQSLSRVWLFVTKWTSPSPRVCSNSCPLSWWCHPTSHPLSSPSPSVFSLSSIRVFSNESVLHINWPMYWSFSFIISPSSEYSGLISFTIDWFDFLAVQGTLKNLFQHHSSKASILRHSAFFMVKLSHPYMTTGKTIALIR